MTNNIDTSAVILDTETTGFEEPQIIELAYTVSLVWPMALNKAPKVFTERFKPTKPISIGAMATHLIIYEDLVDCVAWVPHFMGRPDLYIIGHNVDFDWIALGKPDVKRIDTCALSRLAYPDAESHSLSALMFHLFPANDARAWVKRAHGAAADVVMTWALLVTLLQTYKLSVGSWEALHALCEVARVPKVMPFGMHKGLPMAEVPASYKQWLRKQPNVDEYLLKALQ